MSLFIYSDELKSVEIGLSIINHPQIELNQFKKSIFIDLFAEF